jgi:hypothetical protein
MCVRIWLRTMHAAPCHSPESLSTSSASPRLSLLPPVIPLLLPCYTIPSVLFAFSSPCKETHRKVREELGCGRRLGQRRAAASPAGSWLLLGHSLLALPHAPVRWLRRAGTHAVCKKKGGQTQVSTRSREHANAAAPRSRSPHLSGAFRRGQKTLLHVSFKKTKSAPQAGFSSGTTTTTARFSWCVAVACPVSFSPSPRLSGGWGVDGRKGDLAAGRTLIGPIPHTH